MGMCHICWSAGSMLIAGCNAQTVGVLKKQCQPSTGIGASLSEAASQEYDVVDILAGKAVTAKQARLKKEEAEKCTEENAAACYDHTGNIGIGPVKVGSSTACIFCTRGVEQHRIHQAFFL